MRERACPSCEGAVRPRTENESFPFCSERCRLMDLGRWLDGDYRIPGPSATDTDLAGGLRSTDDEDGGGLH